MQVSTQLRTERSETDRRIKNELLARLSEIEREVSLVREYKLEYDDEEQKALVLEKKNLKAMLALYTRRVESYDTEERTGSATTDPQ